MKALIEPEIEDHCPNSYKALMNVCKDHNIKVELRRLRKTVKQKRIQYKKYPLYKPEQIKSCDFAVIMSPYARSHKAKYHCETYRKPLLHMENGFLPFSIVCDITGFWGDSYLVRKIVQELNDIDQESTVEWANSYCKYIVENNISKRKQPYQSNMPDKDFIFLPMQYMQDQSIVKFTNMKYEHFVDKIASFCADNSVSLAIKKHPRAYKKETSRVDNLFKNMSKKYGNTFCPVDGSMHDFCKNCLFMSGMNTGSIADGCVNHCIISHCGQSLFMNSGAVCHDDDVKKGLEKSMNMIKDKKDQKKMRHKQKLLIYFLYNRYLLLEKDTHDSEYSNYQKIVNQLKKKDLV